MNSTIPIQLPTKDRHFRRALEKVAQRMASRPITRLRPLAPRTIEKHIRGAVTNVRELKTCGAASFADCNPAVWRRWVASVQDDKRWSKSTKAGLFSNAQLLYRYLLAVGEPIPAAPHIPHGANRLAHWVPKRQTPPLSDGELDRLGAICWAFVETAPYVLAASHAVQNATETKLGQGCNRQYARVQARRILDQFLAETPHPSLRCALRPDANLFGLRTAQMDLGTACGMLWMLFGGQRTSEFMETEPGAVIAAPWSTGRADRLALKGRLRKGVYIPGGIEAVWSATPLHTRLEHILTQLHKVSVEHSGSAFLLISFDYRKRGLNEPVSVSGFRKRIADLLQRHPVIADNGRPLKVSGFRLRATFSRLVSEHENGRLHDLQTQLQHTQPLTTELFYHNRSEEVEMRHLAGTKLRDVA